MCGPKDVSQMREALSALDLGPLASVGLAALAVILAGQLGRISGVLFVTQMARLPLRVRLGCYLAYVPKATIQAAFATLPLERGLAQGTDILSIAVLAIVITAPIGLLALHKGSDRLLPVE